RGRLFYRSAWSPSKVVWSLDLRAGLDSEFCTNAGAVNALALSPDQNLLAVASGGRVDLWDIATKLPSPSSVMAPEPVNPLAFSPDRRYLAVACGDTAGTFILRDLARNVNTTNTGASGWICFFSPDGRWLACGLGFGSRPSLTVR